MSRASTGDEIASECVLNGAGFASSEVQRLIGCPVICVHVLDLC